MQEQKIGYVEAKCLDGEAKCIEGKERGRKNNVTLSAGILAKREYFCYWEKGKTDALVKGLCGDRRCNDVRCGEWGKKGMWCVSTRRKYTF